MVDPVRDIVARNRAGRVVALPSVCSAHPEVLKAALIQAELLDRPALIEATSNQVNQFGGYTGMTPARFADSLRTIAKACGADPDRIVLGGDHLGPQAWKNEPAPAAMAKARDMVADYVRAGFTKIHLDCSEPCAGDPPELPETSVAERAAQLARACEAAAPDPSALSYVIGTEVPPPGGVRAEETAAHSVAPTRPEAIKPTLETHFQAFQRLGLSDAASRIVALVVQPGVEFGPETIDRLPPGDGRALRAALDGYPNLCFEAHSTDYQHPEAYPRLAAGGFAFLKVGPALTFAYRQAVYGLDILIDLLDGEARQTPRLRDVLEREMLRDPAHWRGHYHGDPATLRRLRHFSYSDRIRYYWPGKAVRAAVKGLHERLASVPLPDPFLAQVFDAAILARADRLAPYAGKTEALVLASVQAALEPYQFSNATNGGNKDG